MKQAFMEKHNKAKAPATALSAPCLIATFTAAIAAMMLSIGLELDWTKYLMITATAAALAFGLAFTIVEMRRNSTR